MSNTVYRCLWEKCPHNAEPCEFSSSEVDSCSRRTVCPIGEEENFGYGVDKNNEFFLLIVGTRTFSDYELLKTVTDKMLSTQCNAGKSIVIISGGADGADSLAEKYAREKGFQLYVFEADWNEGNAAGYKRNMRMHEYISRQQKRGVLAFWDGKSKGTAHSFELAKRYGNPIKVFNYYKGSFQNIGQEKGENT